MCGGQVLLPAPVVPTVPTLRCGGRLTSCHARRKGSRRDVSCGVWCVVCVVFGRALVPLNSENYLSSAAQQNKRCESGFPSVMAAFRTKKGARAKGAKKEKPKSPLHVSKHNLPGCVIDASRFEMRNRVDLMTQLGHSPTAGCSPACCLTEPHPGLQFIMGAVSGGLGRIGPGTLGTLPLCLYLVARNRSSLSLRRATRHQPQLTTPFRAKAPQFRLFSLGSSNAA